MSATPQEPQTKRSKTQETLLTVGGRSFRVPTSIFERFPSSLLFSLEPDENNTVVIDRSADLFPEILQLFANGEIHESPLLSKGIDVNQWKELLVKELEFYRLPSDLNKVLSVDLRTISVNHELRGILDQAKAQMKRQQKNVEDLEKHIVLFYYEKVYRTAVLECLENNIITIRRTKEDAYFVGKEEVLSPTEKKFLAPLFDEKNGKTFIAALKKRIPEMGLYVEKHRRFVSVWIHELYDRRVSSEFGNALLEMANAPRDE